MSVSQALPAVSESAASSVSAACSCCAPRAGDRRQHLLLALRDLIRRSRRPARRQQSVVPTDVGRFVSSTLTMGTPLRGNTAPDGPPAAAGRGALRSPRKLILVSELLSSKHERQQHNQRRDAHSTDAAPALFEPEPPYVQHANLQNIERKQKARCTARASNDLVQRNGLHLPLRRDQLYGDQAASLADAGLLQ